jgi:ABC-type oligopeptide transport system substrate-binding subunit
MYELDPDKRFRMLSDAEAILLDSGVVMPIYHYSTTELVKPYVKGLYQTVLDTHPLHRVWIDREWDRAPAVAADDGAARAGLEGAGGAR